MFLDSKVRGIFLLLFVLALQAAIGKGWHWAKDGFSIRRIDAEIPDACEALALDEEASGALNQEYRYLGRGHQCYAFISDDGKYVLKLPRLDLYRLRFWMRSCNVPLLDSCRKAFKEDRAHRLSCLLHSFELAFQELREETSLVYLHLGKTKHLNRSLKIRDRFARSSLLDLDRTSFVLQKTQTLMVPEIRQALSTKDCIKTKQILSAFLEFIAARAKKGIYNKDPSFRRNFGWDGTRTIQIDVGSFYRPEQPDFAFSFLQTTGHVKEWLFQVDPEMGSWFAEQMESIVEQNK